MNPSIETDLKKIERLIVAGRQADPEEADLLADLAAAALDEVSSKIRIEAIRAAASETFQFGHVLTCARGLLALGKSSGQLSQKQCELFALVKTCPTIPEANFYGPQACAYFAWVRDNRAEFDRLLKP